jgi:hypothetical protein
VAYFPVSHDILSQHPTRKEIFVGLADGNLHQLFIDANTSHFGSSLTPSAREDAAAITQIYSGFDSAQDGLDDIVVGREGGKVEIYHMDSVGQLVKVRSKEVFVLVFVFLPLNGLTSASQQRGSELEMPCDSSKESVKLVFKWSG